MNAAPTIHAARAVTASMWSEWRSRADLLDARDPLAFAAGHLPGAGNIPAEEFIERRAELPPRDVGVVVVHDEPAAARAAAERLASMGYVHAGWLETPLSLLADGHSDHAAPARLWRPSPFLERIAERLPPGRVIDVAAGSGRESVYLAMRGFDVECLDRAPEALERASALARRHGVTLRTRVVDLERDALPDVGEAQVVMVFRFLQRALFPWLERAVAPAGALVYETYRRGQEVHGRPTHPQFLLVPGELASAFPSLSVELHEEPNPPGGPVMSRLLARRPPLPH